MIRQAVPVVALLLVLWAWAPSAEAYLDPGAGSALLQALIGGAAVVAALVAHQWQRLRMWLSGRSVTSDRRQER